MGKKSKRSPVEELPKYWLSGMTPGGKNFLNTWIGDVLSFVWFSIQHGKHSNPWFSVPSTCEEVQIWPAPGALALIPKYLQLQGFLWHTLKWHQDCRHADTNSIKTSNTLSTERSLFFFNYLVPAVFCLGTINYFCGGKNNKLLWHPS